MAAAKYVPPLFVADSAFVPAMYFFGHINRESVNLLPVRVFPAARHGLVWLFEIEIMVANRTAFLHFSWADLGTRKRLVITVIVLIALSAVFFLFPVFSSAMIGMDYDQYVGYLKDCTNPAFMNTFLPVITKVMFGSSLFSSDLQAANIAMNTVTTFAASLFVVFTLISVIRETLSGEANLRMFLKVFLRVALALFVMVNLGTLTNAIHNIMGRFINDTVAELTKTVAAYGAVPLDSYLDLNIFPDILSYLIMYIVTLLVRIFCLIPLSIYIIILNTRAYALVIELFIRKTFMPFSVLSFIDGSSNRIAVRYIKRYAAVYLRMLMFVAAMGVAEILTTNSIFVSLTGWGSFESTDLSVVSAITRILSMLSRYFFEYILTGWAAIRFCDSLAASVSDDVLGV